MLSLIYSLTKNLIFADKESAIKSTENNELNNIQNILDQVDDIRQNDIRKESQNNLLDENEGCFYKSGIISLIKDDYVLIENKYMCETKNVYVDDLKVGEKIDYKAYRINRGDNLKVLKILNRSDGVWEDSDNIQNQTIIAENTNFNDNCNSQNKQIFGKNQISKRCASGKVIKRIKREVILEEGLSINLDSVSANFVPFVGDSVQVEYSYEVDENSPNLTGEILKIISIKPLRYLTIRGKITYYNELDEYGHINKNIIFSKNVCSPGFVPNIGDKVFSQCIESDQGKLCWRALSVVPEDEAQASYETAQLKCGPQLPTEELEDMLKDKENIYITNGLCETLDINSEKELIVIIKNNGEKPQIFEKCSFLTQNKSQLTLIQPRIKSPVNLNPSDQIIYKFKCKARFVGTHSELVIFKFKKFKIARYIKITVRSFNLEKKSEDLTGSTFKKKFIPQTLKHDEEEEGTYVRGIKPFKPAKFIRNRPVVYKIPTVVENAMLEIKQNHKNDPEAYFILLERIPCFNQSLNFKNYKNRFDNLLYLEELELKDQIKKFTMQEATLNRSCEYLKLTVPGLAEKRPSLIIGDRVIVTYTDSIFGGTKKYEGYIHVIKNSELSLKFDPKFHEIYQKDQKCDEVSFKVSTTVIKRSHSAIDTVIRKLGEDFLFPKKVVEKKSQYNFIESDEEESIDNKQNFNSSIDLDRQKIIEKLCYNKKIRWFNKKLNEYQKKAVKNILKGLARPLPYIIFGPPGTGKTITVCEAVLQIFFTITESRILIATPSNSSANLIAERLLDSKLIQQGELIRLVAHNYLESENIPVRLIPYCVTADISCEGSRADVNIADPRGCNLNVTLSHIQRHRLIVGTCSALGILHNMGCPEGHFTHVIIDEAGQASEPEIMIPLSLAHANSNTQIVLAGDPKQLGPINMSKHASYFGLSESFLVRILTQFPYQKDPVGFENGYDPRLITKLLMNYRSLPDLLDLPNKLFYEAELIPKVHPDNSEEAKLLESLSDILPKRLGSAPPIIFHGVDGKNLQEEDSPSWYNQEEATQVYIYLLELYNHGLQPDDIGIITPYSKQVKKIRLLLADLGLDIPKVGSVEEFQGQERKVIILSTVRTTESKMDYDKKYALGFVSAPERLNVSITRARTLLIIIGNPNLLQKDCHWRSVLEHCDARKSWVGSTL